MLQPCSRQFISPLRGIATALPWCLDRVLPPTVSRYYPPVVFISTLPVFQMYSVGYYGFTQPKGWDLSRSFAVFATARGASNDYRLCFRIIFRCLDELLPGRGAVPFRETASFMESALGFPAGVIYPCDPPDDVVSKTCVVVVSPHQILTQLIHRLTYLVITVCECILSVPPHQDASMVLCLPTFLFTAENISYVSPQLRCRVSVLPLCFLDGSPDAQHRFDVCS